MVSPPSLEQERLRDLVRARDDLRQARTAARHRVAKTLLRYGHVFSEGKKSWTKAHLAWVRRQRLADSLAQEALSHLIAHLDALDAQLAALGARLEQVARSEPWSDPVRWLCSFRGISTHTALGLLAEIGDFRRFASARELMGFLGSRRRSTPRARAATAATSRSAATDHFFISLARAWPRPTRGRPTPSSGPRRSSGLAL